MLGSLGNVLRLAAARYLLARGVGGALVGPPATESARDSTRGMPAPEASARRTRRVSPL